MQDKIITEQEIKLLPNEIIALIKAGEVIDGPHSVVKELVENAIDAGASSINIILSGAGVSEITVEDNGIGISPKALPLVLLRHATSKYSAGFNAHGLHEIRTMGFRGEGISSIATVSKLKIISQQKDCEPYQIITNFFGSNPADNINQIEVSPAQNSKQGTIVQVRDLFSNVPARLKFLKSNRTELNKTLNVGKRLAMSNPNITFNLKHEGKELLNAKAVYTKVDIEKRICNLVNSKLFGNSLELDYSFEGGSIKGYISLPTLYSRVSEDVHLFVNNRPIADKILFTALRIAYSSYLEKGFYPQGAIFLELDPMEVDINVHPAKREVRFISPDFIQKQLVQAFVQALIQMDHKIASTAHYEATQAIKKNIQYEDAFLASSGPLSSSVEYNYSQQRYVDYQRDNNFYRQDIAQRYLNNNIKELFDNQSEKDKELELMQSPTFLGRAIGTISDMFILADAGGQGMIIVDQHAAHERIILDSMKKDIFRDGIVQKQMLLFPERIDFLGRENILEDIISHQKILADLGLLVELDNNNLLVRSIPSVLANKFNVREFISELSANIQEFANLHTLEEKIAYFVATASCHTAIKAGDKMSLAEMDILLRSIEQTHAGGQCNHGRPTYVFLALQEIAKIFHR